jgi:hypothetical protein
MSNLKSRVVAAGSVLTIAATAVGISVLGGGAADASQRAVAAVVQPGPNTVGSGEIKAGAVSQSDMYGPWVKVLQTNYNNSVPRTAIQVNAVDEARLSLEVRNKLNAVGSGAPGKSAYEIAKASGFAGTEAQWLASLKGKDGTNAIVSVTALSNLTNRPDSGQHGNWATDTITRSVSITKQGAVPASNCGAAATSCFFYTGSLIDNGTIVTTDGALSPKDGVAIKGNNSGTMSGGAKLEFFATSDTPDVSLVQGNVDGAGSDVAETTTARWVAQFFPGSVKVTDAVLNDWKWTYMVPGTCETSTQSPAGINGDITGVSACK